MPAAEQAEYLSDSNYIEHIAVLQICEHFNY